MNSDFHSSSIAWKSTAYEHRTSKDGKRTWRTTHTHQHAYKALGLYRETSADDRGEVKWLSITDSIHMRQLNLDRLNKKAILTYIKASPYNPRGPFAAFEKDFQADDLEWIESRRTPTGEINIFRRAYIEETTGRHWSYDFWFDHKTKKLVQLHTPGADIYNPETDPFRNNPPEQTWSTGTIPGSFKHDIVFDANLDESLFQFSPPEGYEFETQGAPQVSEKETIEYLGVLAEFNNKTFPDRLSPAPFSSERIHKVWEKPRPERTFAEQKLLDTNDHYTRAGLNGMPIFHFIHDHTREHTFRYIGKGVKLGDPKRIVCWYRLQSSPNYRVVYGDLNVRDLPPEALPLPVAE